MPGFKFRSEHLITPLKLVLPGIVISMIGLFVNNYFFNNPEKIRGNNSFTAWKNLLQYEKIYSDFFEEINCKYENTFSKEYVDDLLHIQEMTSENLKMLRDDKDIDKQMAAVINLRIDTYAKLKSISQTFFDSLLNTEKLFDTSFRTDYIGSIDRIYFRDTTIIQSLGSELKKKYSFKPVNFSFNITTTDQTIRTNIIGSWSTHVKGQSIKFEDGGKGLWTIDTVHHPFTWKLDSLHVTIHFEENSLDQDLVITIIKCSERMMMFIVNDAAIIESFCKLKEF